MGSKRPKQICPFMSDYTRGPYKDDYNGDIRCQGDRCALWDTWFDECSFMSIAHALGRRRIEEELERKKPFNPKHTKRSGA